MLYACFSPSGDSDDGARLDLNIWTWKLNDINLVVEFKGLGQMDDAYITIFADGVVILVNDELGSCCFLFTAAVLV